MLYNIGPVQDIDRYENFLQTRKEPYAIYLAVNTNIKSFNNICPSEKYIWKLNDMNELDQWYNPKFGIYLGKIVFDKKGNKLIPTYIPTKFENLEEEVKKIKNPLWLANKNPNYIKPKFYGEGMVRGYYFESPNNLEYQCKIEKDTQVLSQKQIISYVKEIHSKNVNMIKNYIDTINKDHGIKPFVFSDEIYDELGEVGIIAKEQANNFKDKSYIKKDPILLAMLDYLAKQNKKDEDYLITFDDEYFHNYLQKSLGGFVLDLSHGLLQNEIKLLFNPAAYMDDTKIYYRDLSKELNKRYEKEILDMGFEGENGYFRDYYNYPFKYQGFFYLGKYNGLSYNELILLDSPNVIHYGETLKLIPSALGKYYFELLHQKEVYIELLRPYYPSIKDLPEGWDNKMLEKANLK